VLLLLQHMILYMLILKPMMWKLLNHITPQGNPNPKYFWLQTCRGSQVRFGKISESQDQTQNLGKFSKISPTPAHLINLQAPTAQSTFTPTTVIPSQPVHSTCTSTVIHMDGHYLDTLYATMSPYFRQSTLATQPPHPSGSSAVADTLSLPRGIHYSTAGTTMTLPAGIQPSIAQDDTPTCTQPLLGY